MSRERILKEFQELVEIDSVSFQERKMADLLKDKLLTLGFEIYEDEAGKTYQSDTGNVYGFLKGSLPGEPVLFSAHMDTVEPGYGKQAVVQADGRITSDGTTVLGADDIAGIVEILEAVRILQEEGIPHKDIEVLFPIAEEAYVQGSKLVDYNRIKAKTAYVLDTSGTIGTATVQEPTLLSFVITVKGKASHAGFAPEEGIHAIAVAAKAIASIKQGHVDKETTVNIGKIQGGVATNIVPDSVTVEGEIRSFVHENALQQWELICSSFQKVAQVAGAEIEISYKIPLHAYRVRDEESVVVRYQEACLKNGVEPQLQKSFGGSDNNSFMQHGIRGVVMACGMYQVHTVGEYTTIQDMETAAGIVMSLMI